MRKGKFIVNECNKVAHGFSFDCWDVTHMPLQRTTVTHSHATQPFKTLFAFSPKLDLDIISFTLNCNKSAKPELMLNIKTRACLYWDHIWSLGPYLTQGFSNCAFIKIVWQLHGLNVALIVQDSTQGEGRCSRVSRGKIVSIAPFMGKYFCPFGGGLLTQWAEPEDKRDD